jgi:hypothetical protein
MILAHDVWHIPSPLRLPNVSPRPRQDREHAFLLVRIVTNVVAGVEVALAAAAFASDRASTKTWVRLCTRLPSPNITSSTFDTCIACPLYASDYLLAFWSESRLNSHCTPSRPSFTGPFDELAGGCRAPSVSTAINNNKHHPRHGLCLTPPPLPQIHLPHSAASFLASGSCIPYPYILAITLPA